MTTIQYSLLGFPNLSSTAFCSIVECYKRLQNAAELALGKHSKLLHWSLLDWPLCSAATIQRGHHFNSSGNSYFYLAVINWIFLYLCLNTVTRLPLSETVMSNAYFTQADHTLFYSWIDFREPYNSNYYFYSDMKKHLEGVWSHDLI